jgi:hypothetical protein
MQKTFKERERALNLIHSGGGWYGLLFDGIQSSYQFTAATTDLITTTTEHNFVNGTRVTVNNTGGSLPTGLFSGIQYRVINASRSTFNLCAETGYNFDTKTGTPIDVANTGSGTHTITEQPLSYLDDLSIWVQHEVDYRGSSRQPITIPLAAKDWTKNLVYIGPMNLVFTPTSASIIYRYFGVIAGGVSTRLDTTGSLVTYEDLIIDQTILPGTIGVPGVGKNFQYTVSL